MTCLAHHTHHPCHPAGTVVVRHVNVVCYTYDQISTSRTACLYFPVVSILEAKVK